MSNSTKKQCLTIDTRDVKDLGLSKLKQICYCNCNKRHTSFNSFLALRKHKSTISDITFSFVKIIDKTKKNTGIYFEINDELSDFNNDNFKRTIHQISEGDTDG